MKLIKVIKSNSEIKTKKLDNILRLITAEFLINDSKLISSSKEEQDKVLGFINNDKYEVNNFKNFIISMKKSKYLQFLTEYTEEELKDSYTTYKVPGYDIGFAIKNDNTITSVHNNSNIHNLGDALIRSAIRLGGKQLDHYDQKFLNDLYKTHKFEEVRRDKWDDELAPQNWNYKEFGKPDIVYRKLKK